MWRRRMRSAGRAADTRGLHELQFRARSARRRARCARCAGYRRRQRDDHAGGAAPSAAAMPIASRIGRERHQRVHHPHQRVVELAEMRRRARRSGCRIARRSRRPRCRSNIDSRAPHSTRVNTSRPKMSVPNRNCRRRRPEAEADPHRGRVDRRDQRRQHGGQRQTAAITEKPIMKRAMAQQAAQRTVGRRGASARGSRRQRSRPTSAIAHPRIDQGVERYRRSC